MELVDALSQIVGKEWVFVDPETLNGYGEDLSASPSRSPDAVAKPRTVDEVEHLVRWANEENMPLIPVSSSSPGLRGATVPRMGGVIVDLTRMNKIIRIDPRNRVMLIEPGVTFEQILPELDRAGLRLSMPILPHPQKSVVAWALEREPAIMPRYHWDIADPLLCVEVVYGNGDRFRTGEAAGPGSLEAQWERGGAQKFPLGPHQVDYHRMIQGSQGTMGIVTWASIKCEIKPALQKCFFVPTRRVEQVFDFAYRMMKLDLADELFIVNGLTLAAILANETEAIEKLRKQLPPWILVFATAGLQYFPEDCIAYRTTDIIENAQKIGVDPVEVLPGVRAEKLLSVLSKPSEEPYWKLRLRGGCREIFFLSTLNKTEPFIKTMYEAADRYDFPVTDIGVYLQPIVQGTSCHVEFDLFYNPGDAIEEENVRGLHRAAVDELMRQGGFFNRPYPAIADQVFSRFAEYTAAARKVKNVFDPNHIMNPGKLCF